jgi:putative endopeptidase
MGISEEIEETVRKDLMKTIDGLDSKHPLALLSRSIMNPHVQQNNVRDLRRFLQSFDCLRSMEDVGTAIGKLNRLQCRAPLTFTVSSDTYESNMCRVHIYEPVLGLPAKHHYQQKPRNRVIMQYAALLKQVGHLLETEGLESVIPIETSVIPALSKGDSLRNPDESYIPLKLHALETKFKHIPWREMLLVWGMPTDLMRKSTFIVTNDGYLDLLNRMCSTMDLDGWRTWLRACVTLTYLEYLPPPFDDLHYELFGRRLRGNVQKLPQRFLMLRVLQTFTTQSLSREFVADHVEDRVKDVATTLVYRLKAATQARIRKLAWMTPHTKQIAVEKVRAMRFQVAYPSEWYNECGGIEIDPERLFTNLSALATRDTVRMIKTLGEGCGESRGTWADGSFDVNAYYYPDRNQLTIPAGMLRPPFFDLRRSVAWNYGGIGSAVGHEITHGFDADGKNYDIRGSYKDWWSEKDNEMYEKMTEDLVKLYDNQEYLGGRVNGRLTLSENIADLGGVAIALTALQAYLDDQKITDRRDAYRDFFISYAVSWRNKDRPRKAEQSLYLDVHAPAPLRVNLVVRQFQEFYEAFGIGPEDPGWIPEKDRIQVW